MCVFSLTPVCFKIISSSSGTEFKDRDREFSFPVFTGCQSSFCQELPEADAAFKGLEFREGNLSFLQLPQLWGRIFPLGLSSVKVRRT